MHFKEAIKGKRIQLCSSVEEDGEFILGLRLDPVLNKHLNPTSPDVDAQKRWLKMVYDKPGDYNFTIKDINGKNLGVVAIYQIDEANKTFNWGRWIIDPEAPIYTALESAILVYHIAFDLLGLEKTLSDVRLENKNVVKFHLSYGAHIYRESELDMFYEFHKHQFPGMLKKFKGFHTLPLPAL
jgi:RimJ/RimL family protein N-acetyltransferase